MAITVEPVQLSSGEWAYVLRKPARRGSISMRDVEDGLREANLPEDRFFIEIYIREEDGCCWERMGDDEETLIVRIKPDMCPGCGRDLAV